jgi:predicted dehydrogenase
MADTPRNPSSDSTIPRRTFIQQTAAAAAGLTIVPRHVLAGGGTPAPSDTFNVAGVGVGGMGRSNLINLASQNIVALCDVDWGYADKALGRLERDAASAEGRIDASSTDKERQSRTERARNMRDLATKVPRARRYTDFRKMLDQQKDIDGIVVATPDHMHATIALAAMDAGKHVYVQKPLCWAVSEARELMRKAASTKVTTQMGNQGHSMDDARKAIEYIWSGAIGEVREVHVWTNRPLAYWPQGVPRPEKYEGDLSDLKWNMDGVQTRLANAMGSYPVPDTLSWNLFLGVAPEVIYHPIYHPFNWRGWSDWGVGALGDMGAHLIDHPFWALDLGYPTSVETVSTPFNKASYPMATITYYDFPARGDKPPVRLTWYDGGLLPPKPLELEEGELDKGGGVMFVGSKGKLLHDTYGLNPRLLPTSLHEAVGTPPQKLPRIPVSHEMNWVQAAKGEAEASSPFSYAARLTEVMILGIVALRAGSKIAYDGENMRITNNPAANEFLTREYRTGW